MVNPFVLLPLYIYPTPGAWAPLTSAAKAHPDVTFYAVINPANGPGAGSCPDSSYTDAIRELSGAPNSNIKTLAYVHTANSYNCGDSGSDICTCSAPLDELMGNITTYEGWSASSSCADNAQDLRVDGVFMDEAPASSECVDYMQSATSFAKSTLGQEATVLFNAGASVDETYWSIADYINVFENSEAEYDGLNVASLSEGGKYSDQSTLMIYDYDSGSRRLRRDVGALMSGQGKSVTGLYISDGNGYDAFPSNWNSFVKDVAAVVRRSKAK